MSLYSKYRPRDWNEVIGQNLIVTILQNNLQNSTTSHAYIFTGSRGTGKTTSARILAKALNCTNLQNGNPCHQCEHCQAFDAGNMLDVIEIDGASNNSVENVRDLIEKAKFEPIQGKYKIYIIDEVHMLSTGAFNALLKTLEEPPKHIKFILATTDIHKVPETILSRTHRFDFRKISEKSIEECLQNICNQEGITTEDGTLFMIAKASHGGMRDAITLLEQHTINKKLSKTHLAEALSLIDDDFLNQLLEILVKKDTSGLIVAIQKLQTMHIQIVNFFDQMLLLLRDKMRENLDNDQFFVYKNICEVIQKGYSSIKSIPDPFLLLEITLMQALRAEEGITSPVTSTPKPQVEAIIPKHTTHPSIQNTSTNTQHFTLPPKIDETGLQHIPSSKESEGIIPQKTEAPTQNTATPLSEFSYRQLLEALKSEPAILATLKTASFKINGTHIDFTFSSKWNADKMNESKYQGAVINALEQSFGGNWTISSTFSTSQSNNTIDDVF